jgi:hypothetical protein
MDPTLTIGRITTALDATFGGLIDMSDVDKEPDEIRRSKFLSRALSAYCIQALTDADAQQAALSVTDSYHDQGIDAIYVDTSDKAVYIVQSKWTRMPDQGDTEKFLAGVRALVAADFSGFDSKIKRREGELKSNFLLRSDNRIILVVAYCNTQKLGAETESPITKYIDQQNNVGDIEVFSFESFGLIRIYKRLSGAADGRISFPIALREWGTVSEPYRAYYGQVMLSDVAAWAIYGKPLFHRNIRFYGGPSDVNDAIERTILQSPSKFWYFNNGITILCRTIKKAVIGGDKRDYGVFELSGVSVINGAQTVGVLWEVARRTSPEFIESIQSKVHVRILSLEDTPEGFSNEVTRATNTQNRIQNRDFAALDPEQHRIAGEMLLDGRRYAFKSGDPDPVGAEGCNIEEATIAIACANSDVALAVQAKREVGLLWLDIEKPPYKTLFNESLSTRTMWRCVGILRAVEAELGSIVKDPYPRGDMVAVHGNRLILRRVFMDPAIASIYRNPNSKDEDVLTHARAATAVALASLCELIRKTHPSAYLATLFKNREKCKDLDSALSSLDEQDPQINLFEKG